MKPRDGPVFVEEEHEVSQLPMDVAVDLCRGVDLHNRSVGKRING